MESAKLASQPFHPVLSEIYLHPMQGLAGQGRRLGEAEPLGWGWVWGHTKLHTVTLVRPCPVTWLAEPCWEGSMKWWSKWVSLVHNSWAETNLCTRQDHLLNFTSMDHCLLAPHKIYLTSLPEWEQHQPLTLFWNNAQIFLLEASRQFGLQSPINPYFFFF